MITPSPAPQLPPIDPTWQRSKFTELRYEYYAAGRSLWFTDQPTMGAMFLGYAIECSLKLALLMAGEADKRVLNSHSHLDLYRRCRTVGVLMDVEVSDDLLHHVSDSFNQRYPKQLMDVIAAAEGRGQAIAQVIGAILAYDDLMMQLDRSLAVQASDSSVRVALIAARFSGRYQGRAIFHSNVALMKERAYILSALKSEFETSETMQRASGCDEFTIQYNLQSAKLCIDLWERAPGSIWKFLPMRTLVGDLELDGDKHFARDFVYPGKRERYVR